MDASIAMLRIAVNTNAIAWWARLRSVDAPAYVPPYRRRAGLDEPVESAHNRPHPGIRPFAVEAPAMASYIVLGTFTEQGRTGAKDLPERRRRGREAAKSLGVTFTAYVTMGAYDVVWIVEAPDDEALAKWIVTIGMVGSVKTQTMRAFTEGEADAILASVVALPRS